MASVTIPQFFTPWTTLVYNDQNFRVTAINVSVPADQQDVRVVASDETGAPVFVIDMLSGVTRTIVPPTNLRVLVGPGGGVGLRGAAGEWSYQVSQPPAVDVPGVPHL
jgi:hypothetical protein